MSLKQRRVFWFVIWLLIILSGPVTVFLNSPLSSVSSNQLVLINYFQRIFGLLAFSLLFIQIMIGAHMERWVQLVGSKAYKIHITQGLITYAVIFLHPLMQMLIDFKLRGLVGVALVLLPGVNFYLNLGKIAFVLITIGVIASYFRTKPFFRRNWRWFHRLNYVAFYAIALHSFSIGTDISSPPFSIVYWVAVISVTGSLFYKYVYLNLTEKFSGSKI